VDCQPGAGNVYMPGDLIPDIVIDHHYMRSFSKKSKIKDIRPQVGSTCTIVTEYYKKLNIIPDKNTATSLYYGMKTDTFGIARSNTKLDLEMMSYITPYISLRKLSKIEEPEIPRYYYKNLYKVLERMEIYNNLIFCDIEEVRNADLIAEMSDFLLRMRDIKWTFIVGSVNKICYFSMRCKSSRKVVGGIATQITKGIGSGGGHVKSAGGQIPLENKEYKEVVSIIKQRLLNILFKNELSKESVK
jgi:nanoRNase/pAp phosphatase (c-di-AMP/oligoRNAs hydrolase)